MTIHTNLAESETISAAPSVVRETTETSPHDSNAVHLHPMNQPAPERFHDLDSLRAAMMLLGVVFHAAWFFIPVYYGHTLSDVEGAWGYSYFFGWVHQFRMQTFFLIAGFFACLLVNKRGAWSFAKNRFMRVVLPLVLGLVTLWPLMKLQYLRGGLISGRIISDEPLWTQYAEALSNIKWQTEWLIHLWFLYTLIVLYVIAWLLRLAFDHVLDRSCVLRPRIELATNVITGSHWGPFVFAIPVAFCMAVDLTWFGIYSGEIEPLWFGIFAYWIFFAVGWCLFSKPQLINAFVSRWPLYVIAGSLMSLVLCNYFHSLLTSGRQTWAYPALTDVEIDYPSLRTKLLTAAATPDQQSEIGVVWNSLSPTYQQFLRDNREPTSDQASGFAVELSIATIFNDQFAGAVASQLPANSPAAATVPTSIELNPVHNRELLSVIFEGDISRFFTPPPWLRVSYFYAYSVASWLLVFGMLGLFRQFMSHPSPAARYMADSSYWLFLVHLPIQFEFSLYVAQWQANSFVKFILYNLITFAIAIPSYHFLVRSTWMGVLLNGRLYPLKKPTDWLSAWSR